MNHVITYALLWYKRNNSLWDVVLLENNQHHGVASAPIHVSPRMKQRTFSCSASCHFVHVLLFTVVRVGDKMATVTNEKLRELQQKFVICKAKKKNRERKNTLTLCS